MNEKVFLVGLPGAGKTTLGLDLAKMLNIPFLDLDQEIEKETRQSIRTIFQEKGENTFRNLEQKHLHLLLQKPGNFVLATGGGTPCFFENMKRMNESGMTLFIDTPIGLIKERLRQDSTRPLMQTNSLEELYKKRIGWYKQARHTVQSYQEFLSIFKN